MCVVIGGPGGLGELRTIWPSIFASRRRVRLLPSLLLMRTGASQHPLHLLRLHAGRCGTLARKGRFSPGIGGDTVGGLDLCETNARGLLLEQQRPQHTSRGNGDGHSGPSRWRVSYASRVDAMAR